jgi:hypothetical protein
MEELYTILKRPILILTCALIFSLNLGAQVFYNHEGFFLDSGFIKQNNIKSVVMRIPNLLDQPPTDIFPFQRLGFNSYGKLAWYENDFSETVRKNNFYTNFQYNDRAIHTRTHRFQRCLERDSLREEIVFHYNDLGQITAENHYHILIAPYADWTFDYFWENDTTVIKVDENDHGDTIRYDAQKRKIEYQEFDWKIRLAYDEKGRRSKEACYFPNADITVQAPAFLYRYIYDDSDRILKIETDVSETVFHYRIGERLPYKSTNQDLLGGKNFGFEVLYEFEYKDEMNDFFPAQTESSLSRTIQVKGITNN